MATRERRFIRTEAFIGIVGLLFIRILPAIIAVRTSTGRKNDLARRIDFLERKIRKPSPAQKKNAVRLLRKRCSCRFRRSRRSRDSAPEVAPAAVARKNAAGGIPRHVFYFCSPRASLIPVEAARTSFLSETLWAARKWRLFLCGREPGRVIFFFFRKLKASKRRYALKPCA